jgi:hypothetical protein
MRITFVCDTLEPGRSGVGDYSWRLAAAIAAMGHQTRVLSFADSYVSEASMGVRQQGSQAVRFCRMPRSDAEQVGCRLEAWPSDWTSLQFVPYSFHDKGFPNENLFPFSSRVGGKHHMMIHETWIGQHPNASWRERAIGFLQKRCCLRVIQAWKAEALHTSCGVYQRILRSAGLKPEILPMFGTIEPMRPPAKEPARCRLADQLPIIRTSSSPMRWAVIFGSLYEPEKVAMAVERLAWRAEQAGILLVVCLTGLDKNVQAIEKVFAKHPDSIVPLKLGQLDGKGISELLHAMDFGITATPLDGVGKSSAAASMRDHGLPVVACSQGAHPVITQAPFYLVEDFVSHGLLENPPAFECRDRVHEVAEQFLEELEKRRGES